MAAGEFQQLLEVQELDTGIDQLRHRLEHLPERARLRAVQDSLGQLELARADARARHSDLSRQQAKLEDEIASLTEKSAQVDRNLYSGTVTAPRELQAMQDEIAAIGRRCNVLEDHVLELMEQLEPIDAELGKLELEQQGLDADATALIAAVAEAEVDIEGQLATLVADRASRVALVPAELLAEYGTLRSRFGGIGVAPLVGGSCGGCHLALSAVEIDRLRHAPPDAVIHCDECGRLLVRTS